MVRFHHPRIRIGERWLRFRFRLRRLRCGVSGGFDLAVAVPGRTGLLRSGLGCAFGGLGLDRCFRLTHLHQTAFAGSQLGREFIAAMIYPKLGVLGGIDLLGLSEQLGDLGFNFGDPPAEPIMRHCFVFRR